MKVSNREKNPKQNNMDWSEYASYVIWCLMPLSTILSVKLWWSVLLVEETGVPGKNPPTCCMSHVET